jgi:hypothetical protein
MTGCRSSREILNWTDGPVIPIPLWMSCSVSRQNWIGKELDKYVEERKICA